MEEGGVRERYGKEKKNIRPNFYAVIRRDGGTSSIEHHKGGKDWAIDYIPVYPLVSNMISP